MPQIDFCHEALGHQGDECLLWPYKRNKYGYGFVHQGGKKVAAHRVVCQLTHGDPPSPKHVAAHKCRNKHCVSPHHVDWKTAKENVYDDKLRDGTMQHGERHGRSKFTDEEIVEMCAQLAAGQVTIEELMERYGVNRTAINKIRSGATWRHVPRILSRGQKGAIGEGQGKAVLITTQVIEIRRLYLAGGITQRELVEMFGVGETTIHAIVNNRTWRHLLPKVDADE